MSGDDKQLELEALAAVGEMLLFDQARGNPEEAARILRCARLFARSEDAAQRLSELCNEAGSDATWRENIVEELHCKTERTCKPPRQRWKPADRPNLLRKRIVPTRPCRP